MSKLLQMVFRFFKYLIQSKSRYSIHSPFVFDFLNDVIRSKKDYYCFSLIQKTKQQLHYNHTKINITELGAGSHLNNNNQKKISKTIILIASLIITTFISTITLVRLNSEKHIFLLQQAKLSQNWIEVIKESELAENYFYKIDSLSTSVPCLIYFVDKLLCSCFVKLS